MPQKTVATYILLLVCQIETVITTLSVVNIAYYCIQYITILGPISASVYLLRLHRPMQAMYNQQ